jgi:hypothetical protein
MLNELKSYILSVDGKPISKRYSEKVFLKHGKESLLKFVKDSTSWMDDSFDFKVRVWATLNQITSHHNCNTCGKLVRDKTLSAWNKYCDKSCFSSDPNHSDIAKDRHTRIDQERAKLRRKETLLKKYGYEYNAQRPEVKKRISENSSIRMLSKEVLDKLQDRDWLFHEHITSNKNVTTIASEIGVYYQTVADWIIKHGIPYTPNTEGGSGVSKSELDVLEFVKTIYSGEVRKCSPGTVISGELDIYVPELNLAIEYNGLYWHSIAPGAKNKATKNKHKDKRDMCLSAGIDLLMVNENDWNFRKEIVKSVIINKFGKSKKLYARECSVVKVSKEDRKQFFNGTHLSGDSGASECYGLMYSGELVSCMSFSKPRFNKSTDWELIRFSTKLGHTVVGGASKILSHFRKNHPGSIGTYADLMIGSGNVYKSIGFEYKKTTNPGYYWTDKIELYNRMKFMKSTLLKKYPEFDSSMTEDQIMFSKGYMKFYDCGHNYYEIK